MAVGGKLNLPTATFDELCSLPAMGPALARRIVEYRQSGGTLRRPDDLLSVPGVTPALLSRLRPRLQFEFDQPAMPQVEPETALALRTDQPEAEREPEQIAPSPLSTKPSSPAVPIGETMSPPAPITPPDSGILTPGENETGELQSVCPPSGASAGKVHPDQQELQEPPESHESALLEADPEPDRWKEPVEPSMTPPEAPRLSFNEDENWPRSYSGINPALLFGEADQTVEDRDVARPTGVALTRRQLVLLLAGCTLVGAVLSIAAIFALNRTLWFVPAQDWQRVVVQPLATVQTESAALSDRVVLLEEAVAVLQDRAEATGLELAALQKGAATVDSRVEALEQAEADLEALAGQVTLVQEEVTTIQDRLERFGGFLEDVNLALDSVLR